jgi:hypothetical protein
MPIEGAYRGFRGGIQGVYRRFRWEYGAAIAGTAMG